MKIFTIVVLDNCTAKIKLHIELYKSDMNPLFSLVKLKGSPTIYIL